MQDGLPKLRNGFSTSRCSAISIEATMLRLSRETGLPDKRIYFLGVGAIAKLIAHSFSDIPEPPPMTLLMHRKSHRDDFKAKRGRLEVIRDGVSDIRDGFDSELACLPRSPGQWYSEESRAPIYNLVLGVKAPFAAMALNDIKDRLRPESTICLIQNGMGLVEELNEKVFPDITSRPNYVQGIVSHGAINKSVVSVEHTGMGNIALTALTKTPYEDLESSLASPVTLLNSTTRYMLRTLTRTPILGCISMSPENLLQIQLEKLASNCVINPLTAIFGCRNGEIVAGSSRVMRLLLAEISLVIRAMPELAHIPNIENRFSPARLESNLRNTIKITAKNQSSMLQDINKGVLTEIEYMNGYIFRRGEELGIRSMVNYTIMSLVGQKSFLAHEGVQSHVPLGDHDADL